MVKEALYGPAAATIHAPKINLAATPVPQFNSAAAAPDFQGGAVTLTSSRNLGFRGPQLPPQYNSAGAARATQGGAVTPTSCQNLGSGDHKYNLSLILLQQLSGLGRDALFQQCYQAMLCLMYPIFFNLQLITLMLAMWPGDLHLAFNSNRCQLLLLMLKKSSRPISRNPEYQNWRNIL
ncbi:uncharacterized protein LOC126618435 isoform X2 [Malus sylvestris]|uniref:uncharacterized protein LOC126618435 isoform X2 n=1 Tax=Malus sylvestris TaxID=3752 RepID=UPI0021ABD824|nr:uncharacterized protein LOC126618435 isoform X2 [Malus sylvestris]